jgi:peptidoglycan/xylan/chitin deacetylase (PgdA/CDA1 family)
LSRISVSGQGPVFRPDLASRNPDLVNEAFREYAINWGNPRVGRLFQELKVPLSIVLNAEFPETYPAVWKEFRAAQPYAPIIAHGMNNSSHTLPLGRGLGPQKEYIRRTLDMIAGTTGVRPTGWSSPSHSFSPHSGQARAVPAAAEAGGRAEHGCGTDARHEAAAVNRGPAKPAFPGWNGFSSAWSRILI